MSGEEETEKQAVVNEDDAPQTDAAVQAVDEEIARKKEELQELKCKRRKLTNTTDVQQFITSFEDRFELKLPQEKVQILLDGIIEAPSIFHPSDFTDKYGQTCGCGFVMTYKWTGDVKITYGAGKVGLKFGMGDSYCNGFVTPENSVQSVTGINSWDEVPLQWSTGTFTPPSNSPIMSSEEYFSLFNGDCEGGKHGGIKKLDELDPKLWPIAFALGDFGSDYDYSCHSLAYAENL